MLNTMHKYTVSKLTVKRYLFASGEGEHARSLLFSIESHILVDKMHIPAGAALFSFPTKGGLQKLRAYRFG